MPILDVSDAFDYQMLDSFQVIRRTQTINNKGRSVVTEVPLTMVGVITAASPSDLARLPEAEYMNKAISIYTTDRIQGPSRDEVGVELMPDHILWHGSVYVVRDLSDYSGYGRGFVSAVATSIEPVDTAPMPAPQGSA